MTGNVERRLAQRLALALKAGDAGAFRGCQIRLSRVLAQLWQTYAELLEIDRDLRPNDSFSDSPVSLAEFRPGDTLGVGGRCARTDPRLVLAQRLDLDGWRQRLDDLARSVLNAPDLARLEILGLLDDLDRDALQEMAEAIAREDDETDQFPVKPPGTRPK